MALCVNTAWHNCPDVFAHVTPTHAPMLRSCLAWEYVRLLLRQQLAPPPRHHTKLGRTAHRAITTVDRASSWCRPLGVDGNSYLLFKFHLSLLYLLVLASAFTRGGLSRHHTNCVDHVSGGGTPGSAVLCELTRHVHPVLSPSCEAEDSRSGDRFQVGLDRGCLSLLLLFRHSVKSSVLNWELIREYGVDG